MNYIKRFLAWIIRGVCVIVGVICIFGAIFSPEDRVGCIVALVVSLIVATSASKIGEKAKAKSVNKCKKCGSTYSGAHYTFKYNLSKATKKTLYNVPVDIEITCPRCGKVRWLFETVEAYPLEDEAVENAIRSMMETYMNKYND